MPHSRPSATRIFPVRSGVSGLNEQAVLVGSGTSPTFIPTKAFPQPRAASMTVGLPSLRLGRAKSHRRSSRGDLVAWRPADEHDVDFETPGSRTSRFMPFAYTKRS